MTRAEALTARGRALHLRVAIDYSARDAIAEAARQPAGEPASPREAFARRLGRTARA